MEKSKLLLNTNDARLSKLKVKPKNQRGKVQYKLKTYDPESGQERKIKMIFRDVAAIEFKMNFFDNPKGAEVKGFYEVFDREEKEKMLKRNFEGRKEDFLYHGDYDYDEDDPYDLLNYKRNYEDVLRDLDSYRLFRQQTTGGVYSILAKYWEKREK